MSFAWLYLVPIACKKVNVFSVAPDIKLNKVENLDTKKSYQFGQCYFLLFGVLSSVDDSNHFATIYLLVLSQMN